MNRLYTEPKQFRAVFVRNPAEKKKRNYNPLHNRPVDHSSVPSHIKEMWEIYLGFNKLEF